MIMIQQVSKIVAWAALAFIVYATLSPLDARPVLAEPQIEHFAAFALTGVAFGLAYPNRAWLITAIVVGSAFTLEALQLLTPDRHGRLLDAAMKAAGGISGIGISRLWPLVIDARINRAR
jgi:VanZ like family